MLFAGYVRGDLWREYPSVPGEVGQRRTRLPTQRYGTESYVAKVTGPFRRHYSVMK